MMKVLVAGGTGFVGKNLLPHLLNKAEKVRLLVRDPDRARSLFVSEVELVRGDITDQQSLAGVCDGIDTVVHLVGIIMQKGSYTFQRVHVGGTGALVEEAMRAGVRRFFYQSALGADKDSPFQYLRTKAIAEEIVKDSGLDYIIFRPSLILGPDDGFTKNIRTLIESSPVVPLPGGGRTRFQPIFIDDWCRAFSTAFFSDNHWDCVYDFGGPQHITYKEIVQAYIERMGLRKRTISVPLGLMKMAVPLGNLARFVKINIPEVSREQLSLLGIDNITDPQACEKYFGFTPRRFEEFLPEIFPS